jgi:phosphate transport system permease protein
MKYFEEKLFKFLMVIALAFTIIPLLFIIIVTIIKGGGVLWNDPGIIITSPGPQYLLGGEGGFRHALLGSLYMVIPATILATLLSIAIALYLQRDYCSPKFSNGLRTILDILWGTPSIIYGVFILIILIFLHQRGCLIAGIAALTLLEFPIITRYADEAIMTVPREIRENCYSMGLTRWETAVIIGKSASPGIIAGILIGLGRGIGDAATVIFTTGAGSSAPTGLFESATALPVLIFQQANSFYSSVRDHAYAASFVLIIIFFLLNMISRFLYKKMSRFNQGA